MIKKTCTKCGLRKPATDEYFYVHGTCKGGLRSDCKACRISQQIKYNKKHTEEKAVYDKKYRHNNRDKRNHWAAKRKANKRGQTPELTSGDCLKLKLMYRIREYFGSDFHLDHIHPLSRGGKHAPDNVQIIKASLNLNKSNKWPLTPEEENMYRGFRL